MWVEVRMVMGSELSLSFEACITPRCALDARGDLQEFMFALLGLVLLRSLPFFLCLHPPSQNGNVYHVSLLCARSMCFLFAFIEAPSQEFCRVSEGL